MKNGADSILEISTAHRGGIELSLKDRYYY
jgi:hypothetical protein